jgi:hypothetical protein
MLRKDDDPRIDELARAQEGRDGSVGVEAPHEHLPDPGPDIVDVDGVVRADLVGGHQGERGRAGGGALAAAAARAAIDAVANSVAARPARGRAVVPVIIVINTRN